MRAYPPQCHRAFGTAAERALARAMNNGRCIGSECALWVPVVRVDEKEGMFLAAEWSGTDEAPGDHHEDAEHPVHPPRGLCADNRRAGRVWPDPAQEKA